MRQQYRDILGATIFILTFTLFIFTSPHSSTEANAVLQSIVNDPSSVVEDPVSVEADVSLTGNTAVDQCVEVPETPGTAVCVCSGSLGCPPDPATCVEIPPTEGSTVCVSTSCESESQTSTFPGADNIEAPFDGCNLAQTITTSSEASCSIIATSNGEVLVDRIVDTGSLGDTLEVCVDIQGM